MAARSGFDGVFNNAADGKPMANLECYVYDSTNSLATIYAGKTGSTLKSQGFLTVPNGVIEFWTNPGYYELEVRDTEIPARVTTRRIPFNAVAGDDAGIDFDQLEIPAGSITNPNIANNNINASQKILDLSVSTGKIANGAIDGSKLGNLAVTHSKIWDESVITRTINGGAVTNAKLGPDCVTFDKIADDAVNSSHIADNSVGTNHIANDAVTGSKIASNSVGTPDLIDTAVTTAKLANDSVTAGKIAAGQVSASELASSAVTSAKVDATLKDGSTGSATMRSLGTGAAQAAAGNDSRLSNQRTPSDLSVTSGKIWTNAVGNRAVNVVQEMATYAHSSGNTLVAFGYLPIGQHVVIVHTSGNMSKMTFSWTDGGVGTIQQASLPAIGKSISCNVNITTAGTLRLDGNIDATGTSVMITFGIGA